MPAADGGLGQALVGDKIIVGHRQVAVTKLLGEGGFSYVYLVKELADTSQGQSLNQTTHGAERSNSVGSNGRSGSMGNNSAGSGRGGDNNTNNPSGGSATGSTTTNNNSRHSTRQGSMGRTEPEKREMVLKVTSILSRQQRDIAEKEAKLLSRLSHPSIIKMFDTCYRSVVPTGSSGGGAFRKNSNADDKSGKERPQHLILMEFCEGGHALDVCTQMMESGERFELGTLIIAFGQICNAVSYLHAQKPPIVHRDLKPANFLVKNGAYKLCDFGSAVFGHVDLKTPQARVDAEEVIQKTTTQMFRAPEMVDLFMAKKLTQATDVWALGCCLYSLAYLQNCFEEGSNLAILSRKYKIPDDNPYGEGLPELIDRMLTVDCKSRADMTEVILCLSSLYSGRPLPERKERQKKTDKKEKTDSKDKTKKKKNEKAGTFRTDTQGVSDDLALDPAEAKKPVQARKLDPNSAAARRMRSVAAQNSATSEFESFQKTDNPFATIDAADGFSGDMTSNDIFGSFQADDAEASREIRNAFQNWDSSGLNMDDFASFNTDSNGAEITTDQRNQSFESKPGENGGRRRSQSAGKRQLRTFRRSRESSEEKDKHPDDEQDNSDDGESDDDDDEEFNVEDDMANLSIEDEGVEVEMAEDGSGSRARRGRVRTSRRVQNVNDIAAVNSRRVVASNIVKRPSTRENGTARSRSRGKQIADKSIPSNA